MVNGEWWKDVRGQRQGEHYSLFTIHPISSHAAAVFLSALIAYANPVVVQNLD